MDIKLSNNCECEGGYDEGCMGEVCYVPIKEDLEENIFPEFLARNNDPLFVKITGKAMGWQRLTGHATIPAEFDKVFNALTINGDWTLRIKLEGNVLTVVRSSHDEPTGATFTIEPSLEEEAA